MPKLKTRKLAQAAALCLGATLLSSGPAAADQIFNDDVIITFSLCVGFDCVNGEAFNFDTIRMKENNTRLSFVDTSGTGFPGRDWRIEANSSASGGASYLALKDMGEASTGAEGGTAILTLTAGAPANSLFVDSTGRVGLKTTTPVLDLHIRTSNTPAMRLEQSNAGGFAAQTWDIAGNEANFFVRDVTGGSLLPLRIFPNAPTSTLVLRNTGVGIGTTNPVDRLHIFSGGATDNVVFRFQNGTRAWSVGINGGGDFFRITDQTAAVARLAISNTGNVGIGTTVPAAQFHTTGSVRLAGIPNCASGIRSSATGDLSCIPSTRHLKVIAGALEPEVALANVMALRPQVGAYKATPEEPEHWLIAEEVAEVDPALVGLKDGEPYTVKTYSVIADLVAVIQQQQRRIEQQQNRIEALERLIGQQ